MTFRSMTTSLALAAGSLLFVAQPALHAQDYGYERRYDRDYRWDRSRDRDRDYRYQRQMEALQRDREELNRALYRRDYRAARREEREIADRERRMEREFGRRPYSNRGYREGYDRRDRDDRYWNR